RNRQVMVGVGGTAKLPRCPGHDAVFLHQFGHRVDAAVLSAGHQFGMHPRAAVASLDLSVDRPKLHEEEVAAPLLGTGRAVAPGIVAGRGDLQRLAEQTHRPLLAVLLDKAEGHSASVAKNAAAFFKMSRSARSRLFSARRRRFSSSKGESLPQPGKACSPWAWRACFQLRMRLSLIPRERAASAME